MFAFAQAIGERPVEDARTLRAPRTWPPQRDRSQETGTNWRELLASRFESGGAAPDLAKRYAAFVVSPAFLGVLSPESAALDEKGALCGWGPREHVLREVFAEWAGFTKWFADALKTDERQRLSQVVLTLVSFDPWREANFASRLAIDLDWRVGQIIDGVRSIDPSPAPFLPPQNIGQDSQAAYALVLRNLIARGLVMPSRVLNRDKCMSEARLVSLAPRVRKMNHWNAQEPEHLEFWFQHLEGEAYDALLELWQEAADTDLAALLRCAIEVELAVCTWRSQKEADERHRMELRERGTELASWANEPGNQAALDQAAALVSAAREIAQIRVPSRQARRSWSTNGDKELELDEAKRRLIDAVAKDTPFAAGTVIEQLHKVRAVGQQAAPVQPTHFRGYLENLLVLLDERLESGSAPKELKAIAAHFGHRVLQEHHLLQEYAPGAWWHRKEPPPKEFAKLVLRRDDVDIPGPVEARLAEAAVHALADMRDLASRSGVLTKGEESHAACRVLLEFQCRWPDFRRYLTLAHQRRSLWAMTKPLMLALLRLNVPCVGPDLRFERKDAAENVDWTNIAHELGVRLRYSLDAEQADDPALTSLRESFCDFLLGRLLPPREGTAKSAPHESRPQLRQGYLRAIRHLGCNPKGRGHRTVHRLLELEQVPDVLKEARRAYEAVRRNSPEMAGADARRSLFSAFFVIRDAQVRAVGGEIAANAARTWYREARDAKNDWKWFSERKLIKS